MSETSPLSDEVLTTTTYLPDNDYFFNQARKFIKQLFKENTFTEDFKLKRLGVRVKSFHSFPDSFKDLLSSIQENFVEINTGIFSSAEPILTDVAHILIFKDATGQFKIHIGPMEKEQLEANFQQAKGEDFPKVALYIDIDYYIENPSQSFSEAEIVSKVRAFNSNCWEKYTNVGESILPKLVKGKRS